MSLFLFWKKIGTLDTENKTYEKINKNQEEIIKDNLEYNTRLKPSNGSEDKSLTTMCWIPKLHENPVGSRFIIASKNCSTKPLSKAIFNVLKLIYSQRKNFHRQSKFLSITINAGYSKMLILPLKLLTS